MLEQAISQRLIELRVGKNYSRAAVADQLNIHQETLRRYEHHPSIMSLDIFLKLLNIYGYTTTIFFEECNSKMLLQQK